MKLVLFSGFLGAGKTTSVLSASLFLLRRMGECGLCDKTTGRTPLVILENEVGDVAYDEALLRNSGLEVKNLLSGCICCTLSTDLIIELEDIRHKYNPVYVIFEPSGAAFPDRIQDSVSQCGIEIEWFRIVTIVDVQRYSGLMTVVPNLIEKQIAAADTILISKTDLLPEPQQIKVMEQIRKVNGRASVYKSPYGAIDGNLLWAEVFKEDD